MRLGILSDATFAERPGGAARASDMWIASAPSDLDLVLCPPGNVDRTCHAYHLLLTKNYSDEEYAFILEQPFTRTEFDYWFKGEGGWQWRDRLNAAAKRILFVSPLHRDVYTYRHHCAQDASWERRTGILPPPMASELYTSVRERWSPEDRMEDAIWYGEWHWFKGPDMVMKWAQHERRMVDFYSPSMPAGSKAPNRYVRLFGYFPEEEGWLDTIASHRTFVHFPRQPECFPYSVLEAYLLGLEVIVNGRLGVESYGVPLDELVAMCDRSRTELWDVVQGALG